MYSLNDDQIRALAPSVYSETPSPTVSTRYGFVPTHEIIRALRDEGFEPTAASQARVRKENRIPYAKHLIRFRQRGVKLILNDCFPEIAIVNDHLGGGSYRVHGGVLRPVCLNGLIVSSGEFGAIQVRHSPRAVEGVVEATWSFARRATEIKDRIEAMRLISLSRSKQQEFAERAILLRWPLDDKGDATAPVGPDGILKARRSADDSDDLWAILQRVQENLVRGGVSTERGRKRSSSPIRSITAQVRVNERLWSLAEEIVEFVS